MFLPKENEKDLDEIPEEIRKNIKFIFVIKLSLKYIKNYLRMIIYGKTRSNMLIR